MVNIIHLLEMPTKPLMYCDDEYVCIPNIRACS